MAKLIVKSPYIKCSDSGSVSGYMRYIATRERVEILHDDRPPTRKQEQLIKKLVKDFPDSKHLSEYMDWQDAPTKFHASAFISSALETHWTEASQSEVYMKYIATRPRAERLGSHGLFGDSDIVDLDQAMRELEHYTGNVWTHIISLKREDAERLGYDNAKAWMNLLRTHRNDIAAAMNIPVKDFRWYAAFHDEGDHPHVHMMAWSVNPGHAYLNQDGIRKIKSELEEYFRSQTLRFALPEGFRPEARLTVAAGGDLMAVDCFTYEDTPHLFDAIADFYFKDAFTCANLEANLCLAAPVGRSQVMGQPPRMNTSQEMMDRFQADGIGIDYVSTANNHCYDYGEQGLLDTLDCLDRRGVLHSGTNRTSAEQEDVLVVERNGIRIALLSYTCDMNGISYEKKYMINEVRFNDEYPDLSLVKRQIARAREKGAECVIASVHWGWEFEMYPHKNIVEMGHRLAQMGIDGVLGSHPHVSQPMERYQTEDGRNHLIVYSLGDFVSYHPLSRNSKLTYVIRFDLVKGTDVGGNVRVCVENLQVKPVYILCQELENNRYDCRLLPFYEVLRDKEGRFGLTPEERKDLPRLEQVVWKQILMPEQTDKLIVR